MLPTESSNIKVLSRETYDNRVISGEIEDNVIYFVVEPTNGDDAPDCLSLYVGLRRQTDIIDLKNLPFDVSQPNQLAIDDITIPNKLYFLQDDDKGTVRLFIKNNLASSILPVEGSVLWESIDD